MAVLPARFDADRGELTLEFRFDDEAPVREVIAYPGGPFGVSPEQARVIERIGAMLGAVASTSYFKARLPEVVRLAGSFGNAGEAVVRDVFREGLGEFAYRNRLKPIEPRFEFAPEAAEPIDLGVARRSLVAIGGGKDSVVALEMLKGAGETAGAICVGSYLAVRDCARIAGLELIEVERRLAPELAAWNRAAAPNGHVPVTAINSLILLIGAVLYSADRVVMANERSADEATLIDQRGNAVNHQYSKSEAFERRLSDWLREEVTSGLACFSLLRPLSELEICRRFARMEQYHSAFVSCNSAYRRDAGRRSDRWCCDCPKCRFVFLAMAPFLDPERMVRIFGSDLLRDEAQATGFADLLRGEGKPWECVGTREEIRAAFGLLLASADWRDAVVVRRVAEEFRIRAISEADATGVFAPSGDHRIPSDLARAVGLPVS